MFPAPTTIATSTPWSRTALTCRATAATRSGSVPYSSSPIRASPESFSSMRLKAGAIAGQSLYPPKSLLAYGEAREPADDHILAGGRRELIAQLLDGPAIELGVVHLLLEQHDRRQPRVQLAGHDSLAHVLRLLSGLQLVDARLRLALLRGDVLAADVLDGRRGGDLHGHLAGERHEVLVLGHEVRVAVHLDQHADLRARVHVGLDGALGGRALAEILDLLALPDPQDLDRLVDVALRLRERLLAVHHPRACALAQDLDFFRSDLHGAHQLLCGFVCSPFCATALAGSAAAAGSAACGSTAAVAAAASAVGCSEAAGAGAGSAGVCLAAGGAGSAGAWGVAAGACAGG